MIKYEAEIAIIGGGLSGLVMSDLLAAAGKSILLLEARPRLGGRIHGVSAGSETHEMLDAGPAWVWPHNDAMLRLLERLNLQHFPQFALGRLVFEDASGVIRRDLDFAPMAGALRVGGGLTRLVEALEARLNETSVRLSHSVTHVSRTSRPVMLSGITRDAPFHVASQQAVFTAPPRVVARDIQFDPNLPPELERTFAATPTWMAGHAKFLASYPTPFWRHAGFSGDAVSHRGPMAEVHDASPNGAATGALFGFIGLTAAERQELGKNAIIAACVAQLTSLFGPEAGAPVEVFLQDWADEPFTATQADWDPPGAHPEYRAPPEVVSPSDDRILFAGTELSPREGGFLEGAVASAEAITDRILKP